MPSSWKITDDMIDWVRSLIGVELRPRGVLFNTEATRDAIRLFLEGIADRNPLYRDEEYAKQTQYQTLVAPPNFLYSVYAPGGGGMNVGNWLPPGNGMDGGVDWEWYRPIRLGDSFTYAQKILGVVEKQTRAWGRAYRIDAETVFWNQHDEMVAKGHGWVFRLDPVEKQGVGKRRPVQQYKGNELREIVEGYRNEAVRGATPRYWEDVEIGEELQPVVRGPLDSQDLMAWVVGAGTGFVGAHRRLAYPNTRPDFKAARGKPIEYGVKEPTWIEDPDKREDYNPGIEHFDSSVAEHRGVGAPFDFGPQRMAWLIMLLTHWQSDVGFLKRLYCELRDVNQLGDTTWLKGRVSDKKVVDGEHLVEVECWGENQLGTVTMPGHATVVLPSRKKSV